MKSILACTGTLFLRSGCGPAPVEVEYAEYDISTLQGLMETGELSSVELTHYYLQRIAAVDRAGPELNSIIELNPDALEIARALDEERRATGPRGPLHGIPVVLKANIDTADQMTTTAGSLALEGHRPSGDAFVVRKLREAGAVILVSFTYISIAAEGPMGCAESYV